jgi:hypothetical protein
MNRRTRYRLSIIAGLLLFSLAFTATLIGKEAIAVTAIGGVMTILSVYIWGETKRPS